MISLSVIKNTKTFVISQSKVLLRLINVDGKLIKFSCTVGIFGDVHFDDEEKFTVKNKGGGVDLFWLTLHELGHSLGLDHSSNKQAIMYPIYRGNHPGLQLHRDDIMGIQQLYGESKLSV